MRPNGFVLYVSEPRVLICMCLDCFALYESSLFTTWTDNQSDTFEPFSWQKVGTEIKSKESQGWTGYIFTITIKL